MNRESRTDAGAALTGLILDLFALSNRLLAAGDRLVADLGLTSARWQVLGTILSRDAPQPVAWLARDMGANRQNIQRIVNDLAAEGMVDFRPNPHHRRAQLVVITAKGRSVFDAAMQLQAPWINRLSQGLTAPELKKAHQIILALQAALLGEDDVTGLP